MSKWVMEISGTGTEVWPQPEYLKEYDNETHDGRGFAASTRDINEALKFDSLEAVLEAWKSVSKKRPLRADGKPNRPLSTFTISPRRL